MAERKNLPAFIALSLVLVVTAAVVLDYWGYVIPATYTQVEITIMEFVPADYTMHLRFRFSNPRGLRVTILRTSYSVVLNDVTLTTDTITDKIVVEGEEPTYLERTLTLPSDIGPQMQAAWASQIWDWEFMGAMSVDTTLGGTPVSFCETSKYAPLFTP
jgi:LEA14-like dessication related protein